ncbi:MAG: aminotransferase class V-fold PLP-dependent enzyme [Planctomycetes bacterium]|nr:aminotransferase class V-fold PLP-dependent enzyme [Planctomycetota bacterium]
MSRARPAAPSRPRPGSRRAAPASARAGQGPAEEAELLRLRPEFPILGSSSYLLSHSMGAMPRGVKESLDAYADAWAWDGAEAWDEWFPNVLAWGNEVGALLHAEPDTVIFHQNVSVLMAIVASSLAPTRRRNRVVYTELNFPTNHYFWQAQAAVGVQPVRIASPDGMTIPTERMVEAIDDRTLAVLVDHGIYVSGYLQDVGAIASAAARHGAVTIVDAYQTVGCVPIDVRSWGADYVLAGSHKWLCGGPGASFLHARPDRLRESEPRMAGWISHERPFAFEESLRYAPNAYRFAGGTPGVASLHAAMPGIRLVRRVGVERIRAKNVRQMNRVIALAEERGLRVKSPRDAATRSGVVCVDFPGAAEACRELVRRRIFVDYRPQAGIRLSAHFYTRDEEVDAFFGALDELRRRAKR